MLNQLTVLKNQINDNFPLLKYWLDARKELLVTYYDVVGIKPYKNTLSELNDKALNDFCHNLIDYLSCGHFNLYEKLIDNISDSTMNQIGYIFLELHNNTNKIMRIYDLYLEKAINDDNCLEFQSAISMIGEVLEERFTLEDVLLRAAMQQESRASSQIMNNMPVELKSEGKPLESGNDFSNNFAMAP